MKTALDVRPQPLVAEEPPTQPGGVVWSQGHALVLETSYGRSFWCGVDDRFRPVRLTCAELRRRGWSLAR